MKKINITPNGIEEVEMTAEEVSKRETEIAEFEAEKIAQENAETQKKTDQANGNQKLLDLGLTQAEATALTGYTPPTEESE